MRFAFVALALTLAVPPTAAAQQPPRDPGVRARADVPAAPTDEAVLRKKLDANPSDLAGYAALAAAQERRGAYAEAEATWMAAKENVPGPQVFKEVAGFYNRTGQFDRTIATLEELAGLTPNDPAGYHLMATFYQEKVSKDRSLAHADKWTYILQGIAAEDRALALKPDYLEAMVYKSMLLREQANLEADPGQKTVLIAEADALRNRTLEMQRGNQPRGQQSVAANLQAPPPAGCARREMPAPDGQASGSQAPVRVGGSIKPPAKTGDVRPVYPPEAQSARVQGVVVLEILITATGEVREPCVLRSIPMLDQAAIDAVSQWQFQPTLLNGTPVAVIMTVTVNFTLGEG